MSALVETYEVKELKNNGSVPALGDSEFSVRFQRQTRWLKKITLHANVTTGGTISATANRDYLERLFSRVQFKVSDAAGTARSVVDVPSEVLLHWSHEITGRLGRRTRQQIRNSAAVAAGTYDLFFPIHFQHPGLDEPIGYRTCLPMFAQRDVGNGRINGLGDDPELRLLMAASSSGLNLGGSSTLTVNRINAVLHYVNAPEDQAYLPQQLQTSDVPLDNGTGRGSWDVPNDGYLGSLLLEEFSDTARAVRASFLSATTGADLFELKYGRATLKQWYTHWLREENDLNRQTDPYNGSTEVAGQAPFVTLMDFLHQTPGASAIFGNSMPNLYSSNKGDLLKLEWPNAASSNCRLRATTHKFLSDRAVELLAGA